MGVLVTSNLPTRAKSVLLLPPHYKQLLMRSCTRSIFLCPEWFDLLAKYCVTAPDHVEVIYIAKEQDVAIMPLICNGRMPGCRHSLTNYYSPIFYPLYSSPAALQELCEQLFQDSSNWKLTLEPLPGDEGFEVLKKALRGAGYVVFPFFRFGNWFLDTAGSGFDEYYEARSGRLKNTIRRKQAKLGREYGLKFCIYTSVDELEKAKNAYWEVYKKSWKQDEPYPAFISDLIDLAATRDWLRLGVLYAAGSPIAVQFWMVSEGIASIYKLAYDESFRDYSPGSILTVEMFRHAMESDHVTEIDYLVGDDPYKKDWMGQRRERWGILALHPHTWRGRVGVVTEKLRRLLKKVRS